MEDKLKVKVNKLTEALLQLPRVERAAADDERNFTFKNGEVTPEGYAPSHEARVRTLEESIEASVKLLQSMDLTHAKLRTAPQVRVFTDEETGELITSLRFRIFLPK